MKLPRADQGTSRQAMLHFAGSRAILDSRQKALKLTANALYGFTGAMASPLQSTALADGCLALGSQVITLPSYQPPFPTPPPPFPLPFSPNPIILEPLSSWLTSIISPHITAQACTHGHTSWHLHKSSLLPADCSFWKQYCAQLCLLLSAALVNQDSIVAEAAECS